jgi:restriction system protein
MLPVLREAASGEVSVRDCIDRLAKEFKLTDEERAAVLPSGKRTVFANRVHWAKTYMAKGVLCRCPSVATSPPQTEASRC